MIEIFNSWGVVNKTHPIKRYQKWGIQWRNCQIWYFWGWYIPILRAKSVSTLWNNCKGGGVCKKCPKLQLLHIVSRINCMTPPCFLMYILAFSSLNIVQYFNVVLKIFFRKDLFFFWVSLVALSVKSIVDYILL